MSDDVFRKFLGVVDRGSGNVAVPSNPVDAISALQFLGTSCLGFDRVVVAGSREDQRLLERRDAKR